MSALLMLKVTLKDGTVTKEPILVEDEGEDINDGIIEKFATLLNKETHTILDMTQKVKDGEIKDFSYSMERAKYYSL